MKDCVIEAVVLRGDFYELSTKKARPMRSAAPSMATSIHSPWESIYDTREHSYHPYLCPCIRGYLSSLYQLSLLRPLPHPWITSQATCTIVADLLSSSTPELIDALVMWRSKLARRPIEYLPQHMRTHWGRLVHLPHPSRSHEFESSGDLSWNYRGRMPSRKLAKLSGL